MRRHVAGTRPFARHGIVLASVAAVALALFLLLACTYERDPLAAWDENVATWVAESLPIAVEWLARPFSWLGGWIGITLLTFGTALALARERSWLDIGFLVAAVAGSQIAVALLKLWFDRPRPTIGPSVDLPASASFPSGHAASGSACLGAVAILASERLSSRRARWWLWAAVVALGVGVGSSRVALGVHYVSDVVAGWCFGLAWLAACLLVRDMVRR